MCVCPLAYLQNHVQTARNLLHILPVAVFRSSDKDSTISYVLPVLRMTSFYLVGPTGQNQLDNVMFDRICQGAAPVGGRRRQHGGEVCYSRMPCYNGSSRLLY